MIDEQLCAVLLKPDSEQFSVDLAEWFKVYLDRRQWQNRDTDDSSWPRSYNDVKRAYRDFLEQLYACIKQELMSAAERSRSELEQLKQENTLLEGRASDAEKKVNMLLEQVETSVGHYRRQSQHGQGPNGISRSHSNASNNTVSGRARADSNVSQESTSFPDNRGSMALDSLANELEALRSHWESTNRNYRLSSQLDMERTPTKDNSDGPAMMSDSLAEWRRRLDEEERVGKGKPLNASNGPSQSSNVI